ncbi:MAG: hypothetical protein UT07_C0001G0038 [Parcubacteria group bacterium GW2011_GWB1_38_8]|uniref:RND efflux pump membrane fusion protein barrel-sandwich domain-containing protein n=1 Tax=Candidatus Zambryskibacteria bacterium RIFCSPLOWO2_02_FULL_39_14 TaxID=1802769 RepID=A0A1G2UHF3_9BACT|nr:MAG: hypothetical protein UT07_C0001G0038 [Parcubacteria group bacterium GW2011_GWB1_38_8]OHB08848.1 MAG: hypothetical protein A3I86_02370 [Candidatus Zambryskibacteria bacterium RIFCSPLOWO2_02_FULL_39_14]
MIQLIKNKKYIFLTILVALIATGIIIGTRANGLIETISISTEDLVRTVKVAGKVIPKQSVDLGFEISGTISNVDKDVGATVSWGESLVRLNSEITRAELIRAEAELTSAQVELSKLEGSGVYETKIENSKRSLIQSLVDAYITAEDAIYNKTDQIFLNPRSNRPEIDYAFNTFIDLRDSINRNRVTIGILLEKWRTLVTSLSTVSYTEKDITLSREYISEISSFLSDISKAVNAFEEDNVTTQTTIDKYRNDTIMAQDNVSTVSQNITTEENKLRDAISDTPIQVAKVEAAKATVLSYRSQLSRSQLLSPINGIVSKQTAKIGQVTSPGTNVVSVISKDYILETFIPEVLIGGVKIGDSAKITLDAYSNRENFEARVSHIDPAETIRDGVSTYKVKLVFIDTRDLVRSGMTANIEIEIFRKVSASLIPERAIVIEKEESFVYVIDEKKNMNKKIVKLGEKDSRGNVEILSGLSLEDKVVLNPIGNN